MNNKIRIACSTLVILIIVFLLSSCGSGLNTLNDSLNYLKKGNVEKYTECLSKSSKDEIQTVLSFYNSLHDNRKSIVNEVYSYLKFSIKETDNKDYYALNLTYIDTQSLMIDLSNTLAIEGIDLVSAFEKLKNNGTLEKKYLIIDEFNVRILLEDNKYVIPFNQGNNNDLYLALNLLSFLRWISNV